MDVGLFEPTPLDQIEDLHHEGLPFYQPALYVPGELLVRKGAEKEAGRVLDGMGIDSIRRDVGPGGLTCYLVPTRNVPDLALEVETRIRGSKRRTAAAAPASDSDQTYGNRDDTNIRLQLDDMGLRPDQPTYVGPNHLYTPTPVCGVGPADEPVPAAPIPPPRGTAGKGVRVAIIDTGIFTDVSQHPWLAADVHYSLSDIEPPDADGNGIIDYVSGHGHFVAGIVRTVAPKATIFVERLFHCGKAINEWELNRKLHEVIDAKPHIINLSLTGQSWNGTTPPGLADVWRRLKKMDPEIVVVAAAGNAGNNQPFWPAAQPGVVAVGAVNDSFQLPAHPNDFSNYGPWVTVYARGVRVVNAFTTGKLKYELSSGTATFTKPFCSWSGTSFATPHVTGKIAARMTSTTPHLSAAVARDRVIADAKITSPSTLAPDSSPVYVVK